MRMNWISSTLLLVYLSTPFSYAQSQETTSCINLNEIQIRSATDLEDLQSCTTIQSLIIVGTDLTSIRLPNLQSITNSIRIERNDVLESLELSKLQEIRDTFHLLNNTRLRHVSWPRLQSIQNLNIHVNPALDELNFPNGLMQVSRLSLIDNGVKSIKGLAFHEINDMEIKSLNRLSSLQCPDLMTVNGQLSIVLNHPKLTAEMNHLSVIGKDLLITHLSNLSMSALNSVGSTVSISETLLKSIHWQNLASIGKDLIIRSNTELAHVEFPSLQTIEGSMYVTNNTKTMETLSFPTLNQVRGSIDIVQDFEKLDISGLTQVDGALQVHGQGADCSSLAVIRSIAVNGEYSCSRDHTETHSSTPTSSTSNNNDNNSNDSHNENDHKNDGNNNDNNASAITPSSSSATSSLLHPLSKTSFQKDSPLLWMLIVGMTQIILILSIV